MAKKRCCSICNNEGHNSRTCIARNPLEDNAAPEGTSENNHSGLQDASENNHSGLQLNLTLGRGSSNDGSSSSQQPQLTESAPARNSKSREVQINQPQPPESAPASNNNIREVQINKGVRWSPAEHMSFLKGIQMLGKGAWKAISERYVRTRTANQISSHAQKYYKRMKNPLRRKRNPSIFDIGSDEKPQSACIPFIRLGQISRHRQLQPNNRLHPLPPSPNPGTRKPTAGADQSSSGHGQTG